MRHLLFISLLFLSIPSFAQLTTGEKYNLGPIGQPNQTLQIKGRAAYTVHPWYTSGDDGLLVDKHYTDSAIGSAVGTPSFSFVKGGNSFATSTQIGLGDNFSLTFITNNTEWAKLDSLGRFTIGPASGRMNAWPGLAGVLGNTGFGYQTLNATHTSAVNNTAIGSQALSADTSGSQNSALGNGALKLVNSGSDNTGFGYRSGGAVTTGIQNTFGGSASATAVTTGSYNTAWGYSALAGNVSSNYNTAIGAFSNASGTGASNTSVGAYSLQVNGAGYNNVSLGNFNMNHNSTGVLNTSVGSQALYLNTSGMQNTALGAYAGDSSATGYGGVFIGYMSGYHEQSIAKFHLADSLNAGRTLLYGDFLNRKLIVTPPGGNGTPSFLTGDNFQVNGSSYFSDSTIFNTVPNGTTSDSVAVLHQLSAGKFVLHKVAFPSGSGSNYQTFQSNGTDQTQEAKANFSSSFTLADDGSNSRTNISIASIPSAATATTQAPGDNSTKVSTTAYADATAAAAAAAVTPPNPIRFTQTANGTALTNTTSGTDLSGSGGGSTTFFSNVFAAGDIVISHMTGTISTAASSPGNLSIGVNWTASDITIALPTSLSSASIDVEAVTTILTTGSGGTAEVAYYVTIGGNAPFVLTGVTGSINTTTNTHFGITGQFSTASSSNSIQSKPPTWIRLN